MVTLCGISAWQYLRTPPALRDEWMDAAALAALLPERSADRIALKSLRTNAREADRLVHGRLLGDLKGVSLPVHVLVDPKDSVHKSSLTIPHRISGELPRGALEDIGGGLSVLRPEYAIALPYRPANAIQIAKMIFEACGIFSILPSNDRLDIALKDLTTRGIITRDSAGGGQLYGFSDERGIPLASFGKDGESLPWTPTFDRRGRLTDLWKRPPLTDVASVSAAAKKLTRTRGLPDVMRALGVAKDGAASPAEVQAVLLLCSGPWFGGESFGSPDLNRRIIYTSEAAALAQRSFAIADLVWPDKKLDFEVQGEAFHADEQGFVVATGRTPALESMGYTVKEITPRQMADLELFDTMLPALAKAGGFGLRERTAAFLRQRGILHDALFGEAYDPD